MISTNTCPSHLDNSSHSTRHTPFQPNIVWGESFASESLTSSSPNDNPLSVLPRLSADSSDLVKEELHRAAREELPGNIAVFDDAREFDPLGDSFLMNQMQTITEAESHQRARLRRKWESLTERQNRLGNLADATGGYMG
jgi:hypothetical protein